MTPNPIHKTQSPSNPVRLRVLFLALIAVATVGLSLAAGFAVGVMFAGARKTERTPEHLRTRRARSSYVTHG